MTQMKLYGENAFTFLFFDKINGDKGALKTLLENLKRFDKPKSTFLKTVEQNLNYEAEIWLFPSFGKRSGFGEPDALLLVDTHVFWFEVETKFDLGPHPNKSKAIGSLRQLYRFHCAALAFAKGPRRENGRLVIKGPTITNEDRLKSGRLALRGHEAVAKLGDQLRAACKLGKSHYVLLSDHQPSGGADGFHRTLKMSAATNFNKWDRILKWPSTDERLKLERCWYTYWRGDLKRFFKKDDFLAGYVPIKKGS